MTIPLFIGGPTVDAAALLGAACGGPPVCPPDQAGSLFGEALALETGDLGADASRAASHEASLEVRRLPSAEIVRGEGDLERSHDQATDAGLEDEGWPVALEDRTARRITTDDATTPDLVALFTSALAGVPSAPPREERRHLAPPPRGPSPLERTTLARGDATVRPRGADVGAWSWDAPPARDVSIRDLAEGAHALAHPRRNEPQLAAPSSLDLHDPSATKGAPAETEPTARPSLDAAPRSNAAAESHRDHDPSPPAATDATSRADAGAGETPPAAEKSPPAVARPLAEVARPMAPVREPAQAVAEIARPITEVARPITEVAQPIAEVARPMARVREPAQADPPTGALPRPPTSAELAPAQPPESSAGSGAPALPRVAATSTAPDERDDVRATEASTAPAPGVVTEPPREPMAAAAEAAPPDPTRSPANVTRPEPVNTERRDRHDLAVESANRLAVRHGVVAEIAVPELGSVRVDALRRGDALDLSIVAERAETARVIEDARGELSRELRQEGVRVATLDVATSAGRSGTSGGGSGSPRREEPPSRPEVAPTTPAISRSNVSDPGPARRVRIVL